MLNNVGFEAVIIIGLYRSKALLSVLDYPINGNKYEVNEYSAIKEDIAGIGDVNDWIDYLGNFPINPGEYKVTGEAYMTEDEGQYSGVYWDKIK